MFFGCDLIEWHESEVKVLSLVGSENDVELPVADSPLLLIHYK